MVFFVLVFLLELVFSNVGPIYPPLLEFFEDETGFRMKTRNYELSHVVTGSYETAEMEYLGLRKSDYVNSAVMDQFGNWYIVGSIEKIEAIGELIDEDDPSGRRERMKSYRNKFKFLLVIPPAHLFDRKLIFSEDKQPSHQVFNKIESFEGEVNNVDIYCTKENVRSLYRTMKVDGEMKLIYSPPICEITVSGEFTLKTKDGDIFRNLAWYSPLTYDWFGLDNEEYIWGEIVATEDRIYAHRTSKSTNHRQFGYFEISRKFEIDLETNTPSTSFDIGSFQVFIDFSSSDIISRTRFYEGNPEEENEHQAFGYAILIGGSFSDYSIDKYNCSIGTCGILDDTILDCGLYVNFTSPLIDFDTFFENEVDVSVIGLSEMSMSWNFMGKTGIIAEWTKPTFNKFCGGNGHSVAYIEGGRDTMPAFFNDMCRSSGCSPGDKFGKIISNTHDANDTFCDCGKEDTKTHFLACGFQGIVEFLNTPNLHWKDVTEFWIDTPHISPNNYDYRFKCEYNEKTITFPTNISIPDLVTSLRFRCPLAVNISNSDLISSKLQSISKRGYGTVTYLFRNYEKDEEFIDALLSGNDPDISGGMSTIICCSFIFLFFLLIVFIFTLPCPRSKWMEEFRKKVFKKIYFKLFPDEEDSEILKKVMFQSQIRRIDEEEKIYIEDQKKINEEGNNNQILNYSRINNQEKNKEFNDENDGSIDYVQQQQPINDKIEEEEEEGGEFTDETSSSSSSSSSSDENIEEIEEQNQNQDEKKEDQYSSGEEEEEEEIKTHQNNEQKKKKEEEEEEIINNNQSPLIVEQEKKEDDEDEEEINSNISSSTTSSSKKKEDEKEKKEEDDNDENLKNFELRRKSVIHEMEEEMNPEGASSLALFVTLVLFLFYIISVFYTIENIILDYKVGLLYAEDKSRTIREEEKEVLFYIHQGKGTNETNIPSLMFQKICYPDNIELNMFTIPVGLGNPLTLLCPTFQEGTGKLERLGDYETIVFGYKDPTFEFELPYGFSFQSSYWILLHFQWSQIEEVSETLSDNILHYILMLFPSISLEHKLPKVTLALKKVSVIEKKVPGTFTERKFSVVVDEEVKLKRFNRFPFTFMIISIITLLGSVLALRFPITKCLQRFNSWIGPSFPYITETVSLLGFVIIGFVQLYLNIEYIEPVFLWHLPIFSWKVCCLMLLSMTLWQTGFCGSMANIDPSIGWIIDCCIEPYITCGLYTSNSIGLFISFCTCWCSNCIIVLLTALVPLFLMIVFLMDVSDTSGSGDGNMQTRNFVWDVKIISPILAYTFSGLDFLCFLHLILLILFWKCCCMRHCVRKKKKKKRFKYRDRNSEKIVPVDDDDPLFNENEDDGNSDNNNSNSSSDDYIKKNESDSENIEKNNNDEDFEMIKEDETMEKFDNAVSENESSSSSSDDGNRSNTEDDS